MVTGILHGSTAQSTGRRAGVSIQFHICPGGGRSAVEILKRCASASRLRGSTRAKRRDVATGKTVDACGLQRRRSWLYRSVRY